MIRSFKAHYDGKTIVPDEPIELPINQPLTLHVETEIMAVNSITGSQLAESGFAGLWKDRKDINDSVEFASKMRKRAESRRRKDP